MGLRIQIPVAFVSVSEPEIQQISLPMAVIEDMAWLIWEVMICYAVARRTLHLLAGCMLECIPLQLSFQYELLEVWLLQPPSLWG